jgi:uncharacterized protein with von Willebrand factor type A (vWA) domain
MVDRAYDTVGPDLLAELTDFTFALRLAGVAVTIDGSMAFLRTVAGLNSRDHVQIYWAGRNTLCEGPADFGIYDETFNWFFRREIPVRPARPVGRRSVVRLVTADGVTSRDAHTRSTATDGHDVNGHQLDGHQLDGHRPDGLELDGGTADPELIPHDDLTGLAEDELAELTALVRLLDPVPTRRRSVADSGRSLAAVLRSAGQDGLGRRLGVRPRTLVLLVDVSDSMAGHAEAVLRFAHAARRALGSGCLVHTIGHPMRDLSTALDGADPVEALDAAAELIPGWNGTAPLGQSLWSFLDDSAHRRLTRGAVVVVVSDGCDRGSSQLLIEQARRLSRTSRTFVWVNPNPAVDGLAPATRGLLAVRPFCDHLFAGQALTALGELMNVAGDA